MYLPKNVDNYHAISTISLQNVLNFGKPQKLIYAKFNSYFLDFVFLRCEMKKDGNLPFVTFYNSRFFQKRANGL